MGANEGSSWCIILLALGSSLISYGPNKFISSQEILLCKPSYKNDVIDRRVILYLTDCCCGKKFCRENSALAVRNCLRSVTLKHCAIDFSIE